MNKKRIGVLAMLSSPFLALDLLINGSFDNYHPTSLGGLYSFIYMTGWLLCVLALYYTHASASQRVKTVLVIQIIFLCLAEVWNVYSIIDPRANNIVFRIVDVFWPVSNAFMLVTGAVILSAKKLTGWQRYMPLAVGFWLPIAVVSAIILGKTQVTTAIVCSYSALAWWLLGLSIYTNQYNDQTRILKLAQAA